MSSSESNDTDTEMVEADDQSVEDFATPGEINDEDAEGEEDDASAGIEAEASAEPTSGVQDDTPRRGYRARPTHERDISVIQSPPAFIGGMRQSLFDVAAPVELKPEEFEMFWPFVDNVWVRQHKAGTDRSGTSSTDYYACRLQRPTYTPKGRAESDSAQEGKQKRKKRAREGGTCQARVKTVTYRGAFEKVTVIRVGHHGHTHDLDAIDKLKRNTVMMDVARTEVQKGYMPTSVFNAMRADPEKLAVVGGKFMKVNDVRNASQVWRSKYTGELRAHPDAALSKQYAYTGARTSGAMNMSTEEHSTVTASDSAPSGQPRPPVGSGDTTHPKPLPPDTLFFPPPSAFFLQPYLPDYQPPATLSPPLPHVTLSYAASLDSLLSLERTVPTPISSLPTKAMTHYLRARHDAILIGVGTAICDDPTLNCRLAGAGGYGGVGWSSHPRPVILDPGARWDPTPESAMLKAAAAGRGRAPWVVVQPAAKVPSNRIELLQRYGGKFVMLPNLDARFRLRWEDVLRALYEEGIRSVLVEGGATVASEMLGRVENRAKVHSVILTLAPTYLGQGGVPVGPPRKTNAEGKPVPALRFVDVRWCPLGEDVVMCARMPESPGVAVAAGAIGAGDGDEQTASVQQQSGSEPAVSGATGTLEQQEQDTDSSTVPSAPMAPMMQEPSSQSDPEPSTSLPQAATTTTTASPRTPTSISARGRGRGGGRGTPGSNAPSAGRGRGRGRGGASTHTNTLPIAPAPATRGFPTHPFSTAGGASPLVANGTGGPGGPGGPRGGTVIDLTTAQQQQPRDTGVMSQQQAQDEMRRRMEMYARGQIM